MAIKRLEESVGVPLFVRTKSGVQLTRAGKRFLGETRRLLEQWSAVRAVAEREDVELGGRFVVGVHPSVGLATLPRLLPQLLATHPELEIHLVHDHSRELTEAVIRFEVDFGLVVNPRPHPDLTIKPLYKDVVTLWVAEEPSALQDPGDTEAVLIADPALTQSQEVMRALAKKRIAFRRTIATTSLELAAVLTAAGAGVGLLPARVAERAPGLRELPGGMFRVEDQHCLVYRADAQRSPASRALARWIRDALVPGPPSRGRGAKHRGA
jgi:DNA-binding transcriptional LysR family regulator